MLCPNVHGDLAQIQVRADPRSRGDARLFQHVQDHPHGKLPRGKFIGIQIFGRVDEHLVDGIHVDVLRRDIVEVNIIDLRTTLDVMRHARPGNDIVERQRGRGFQFQVAAGCPREGPSRCAKAPLRVHLLHLLHDFEQPRPARDAIRLEGGGDCKADRLFRAAFVCNDEVGGHRVEPAFRAFHRSVEGFEVDAKICPLCHAHLLSQHKAPKYEHPFVIV